MSSKFPNKKGENEICFFQTTPYPSTTGFPLPGTRSGGHRGQPGSSAGKAKLIFLIFLVGNKLFLFHHLPFFPQLRYLQTLNNISAEKNSTIVFPVPVKKILSKSVQFPTKILYVKKYLIEISLLGRHHLPRNGHGGRRGKRPRSPRGGVPAGGHARAAAATTSR